jgi:hypothetical protein
VPILCRCCSPSLPVLSFFLLPMPFLAVRCEPPGVTLATQNGIQIITGNLSRSDDLAQLQGQAPAQQTAEDRPGMCGGFALVLLLVLATVTCGFALPAGELRLALAGGPLLVAAVALYAQMGLGFPVEQKIAASAARSMAPGNRLPLGPQQQPGAAMAGASIQVRYTAWFWLWLALLHLGLLGLVAETLVIRLVGGARAL